MKRVTGCIGDDSYSRLKSFCRREGRRLSEVIESSLLNYLPCPETEEDHEWNRKIAATPAGRYFVLTCIHCGLVLHSDID